ncbi:MAG: hypothetical protein JO151_10815 [Verrucomicrobia bacterium]|nr:hypothetical protein [Verrucomicrobiota bacterium]
MSVSEQAEETGHAFPGKPILAHWPYEDPIELQIKGARPIEGESLSRMTNTRSQAVENRSRATGKWVIAP